MPTGQFDSEPGRETFERIFRQSRRRELREESGVERGRRVPFHAGPLAFPADHRQFEAHAVADDNRIAEKAGVLRPDGAEIRRGGHSRVVDPVDAGRRCGNRLVRPHQAPQVTALIKPPTRQPHRGQLDILALRGSSPVVSVSITTASSEISCVALPPATIDSPRGHFDRGGLESHAMSPKG